MPTNLPPEYFEADKRFREAQTPAEKVATLEELISTVPKHKGTDHLRADLRRQLSKLREEAQSKKKHGSHQSAYQVEKEGAGQVVVIGPANTGKSALVAALTNARPEVSPASFTTRRPVPGMLDVESIQVQLVDAPSLERDFVQPGLFDLLRHADMALLVVDLEADPLRQIEETLQILEKHRIAPLEFKERYHDRQGIVFIPLLVLVNKCDDESLDETYEVFCELFEGDCPIVPVSAINGRNFEVLKRWIFEKLAIIRVYAKPPGKPPDMERPFVLKKGSTILDLARRIHKDFFEHMKTARVWGSTAFGGQLVQRDYVLEDRDVVEFKL